MWLAFDWEGSHYNKQNISFSLYYHPQKLTDQCCCVLTNNNNLNLKCSIWYIYVCTCMTCTAVSFPSISVLKILIFFPELCWKKRHTKCVILFMAQLIAYYIKTYSIQQDLSNHVEHAPFQFIFWPKKVLRPSKEVDWILIIRPNMTMNI